MISLILFITYCRLKRGGGRSPPSRFGVHYELVILLIIYCSLSIFKESSLFIIPYSLFITNNILIITGILGSAVYGQWGLSKSKDSEICGTCPVGSGFRISYPLSLIPYPLLLIHCIMCIFFFIAHYLLLLEAGWGGAAPLRVSGLMHY